MATPLRRRPATSSARSSRTRAWVTIARSGLLLSGDGVCVGAGRAWMRSWQSRQTTRVCGVVAMTWALAGGWCPVAGRSASRRMCTSMLSVCVQSSHSPRSSRLNQLLLGGEAAGAGSCLERRLPGGRPGTGHALRPTFPGRLRRTAGGHGVQRARGQRELRRRGTPRPRDTHHRGPRRRRVGPQRSQGLGLTPVRLGRRRPGHHDPCLHHSAQPSVGWFNPIAVRPAQAHPRHGRRSR